MLMMKNTKATGSAASSSPTLDVNISVRMDAPAHGVALPAGCPEHAWTPHG